MSDQPHLLVEQSSSKLEDESGRALLAESPLEPLTPNIQSPDALLVSPGLSGQAGRSKRGQVKLPPINSSTSSPQLIPLKKVLGKKAALADISSSPVRPSDLFQVDNILKMNAFVNWDKLRDYVFAHRVTGKMNVLLDEKSKHIERDLFRIIVLILLLAWVRFKTFYFDPESWFIVSWRFLFELATMYFVFVYSYLMAFHTDVKAWSPVTIVGRVIDCFFGVTIILNFFIALKKPDGSLITNKEVIARTYITTFFLFDLITLIPFEQFEPKMAFIRLFRVIHISTFFRHMNEFADLIVPYFVEGLAIIKISDFIGSLATVSLLFALIFHFFACIWIALGFPQEPNERTWFDNIAGNGYFDADMGLLIGGNFEVYVCSLFHIAQTFSTIGYGNLYGFATREYIFSMALLFLGILLFVFSFEKVKSIIGSFNEEEKRENEEADEVESWLNMIERTIIKHKDVININLINEIKAVLTYRVQADWQELFLGNEQFKKLDYTSSEQVLDFGLKKFKEKFHILFGEISDPLIHLTVIQSDSRLFVPGEEILQKGKHCKGIFLILRGTVLLAGSSKEDYFTRLGPGSFFGEMSLTKDRKNPIYYISESEVNCLFIRKEAFEEVAGKFPRDMEKLKALAYYRYKHFLYQKHQHQVIQMNPEVKPVSADMGIPENRENNAEINSPGEGDPLTLGDEDAPKKTFKEDGILESPEKLLKPTDRKAPESLKKFQIDEEDMKHYQKISKKAESQARKLKRLLSIDQDEIELAENSTDSDEDPEAEEEEDEEEEDEDEGGDDGDDDSSVNDDELNSSDIYPLEMKFHFDGEEEETEKDVNYLEERIMFMQTKLAHVKKKFYNEMQTAVKRQRYCAKRLLKTETLQPFKTARSPENLPNQ